MLGLLTSWNYRGVHESGHSTLLEVWVLVSVLNRTDLSHTWGEGHRDDGLTLANGKVKRINLSESTKLFRACLYLKERVSSHGTTCVVY